MIDSHVHFFPDSMIKDNTRIIEDPVYRMLYGSGAKKAVIDDVIRHMEEHGIEKSIAMGFSFKSENLCLELNAGLLESCVCYPGRVIPFASLSPETPDPEQALERISRQGFRGVGEIAFYGDICGPARKEWLDQVLKAARKFSLIVCMHVNEPLGHDYPGKYSTESGMLYNVIRDNPGVRIILSHWGGGIFIYELMPEVREAFRDVYYDTAASPFLYDNSIYRSAISITGSRKILFGTDFPLIAAGRYFKNIMAQEIEKTDLDNIMGNNATRILGG